MLSPAASIAATKRSSRFVNTAMTGAAASRSVAKKHLSWLTIGGFSSRSATRVFRLAKGTARACASFDGPPESAGSINSTRVPPALHSTNSLTIGLLMPTSWAYLRSPEANSERMASVWAMNALRCPSFDTEAEFLSVSRHARKHQKVMWRLLQTAPMAEWSRPENSPRLVAGPIRSCDGSGEQSTTHQFKLELDSIPPPCAGCCNVSGALITINSVTLQWRATASYVEGQRPRRCSTCPTPRRPFYSSSWICRHCVPLRSAVAMRCRHSSKPFKADSCCVSRPTRRGRRR
jgi:hypothetical protein